MTLLQHHVFALLFTGMTALGLGSLVFLTDCKRRLNQVFGLYSLSIAWWAIPEAFLIRARDQSTADLFGYLEWPGVIFIAPTFIHTVLLATDHKSLAATRLLRLSYLLGAIFTLLHLLFYGLVAGHPRPVAYVSFHNKLGLVGWGVLLTFTVLVTIALQKLWTAYRHATGQRRTQLKFLFWGSFIGYLGGSPDWLFTVGTTIPLLSPFGIYGVPLYFLAMTYAIFQHRLFDVHLVIRKSLVYSLLVTLLTSGYFGLVYAVEHLFQVTFGYRSVWVSIAAFAVMAFAFQPLKISIQRLVDRMVFRVPHEELVKRMERLEQETRQTEKLKAVATLAAGMAHEIKNPLASLKTFAEYLPQKYDDPTFREKFSRIVSQEVERINALVKNLLEFAKPSRPASKPTRLSPVIDETLALLQGALAQKRIEVVRRYAARDDVVVDPAQMKQVFLNVILNSIEAMDPQGILAISTAARNGHLDVLVSDTGPGITDKELPHVFDPFYTTKTSGTGLGLSVVHSIIKEHGGRVTIESDIGRGTTVKIQLPTNGGAR